MEEALERRKRLRALQQQIEQGVQQFSETKPAAQILPNPLIQEFTHNTNSVTQAPMMQTPHQFQRPMMSNFQPQINQHLGSVRGRGRGQRRGRNQFYNQQIPQQIPFQMQQQPGIGFSSLPHQICWNQQLQHQQQGFQEQLQIQQQQNLQQILQQQVIDVPQQQQFLPEQFLGQGQGYGSGQIFSGQGGFKRKWGDKQKGGGRDSPRPYKKQRFDTGKLGNDFKTIEKHFFSDKFLDDPWKHFPKK